MGEQFRHVHFVIETLAGGPVLSEGVTRYEQAILLEVGEHTVRPVEHPGFDELHGPGSQTDRLSGFHDLKRPVVPVEMIDQVLFSHGRTDDLFGLNQIDDLRCSPRVIHLHMIHHEVVNFLGIHNSGNVTDQIVDERLLDRIKERNLFIHDQIGVVS